MIVIDDTTIAGSSVELINSFGKREITHVIHDIDGTHSLIRDWPPVMSLAMHWAMTCGLESGFDSPENLQILVERVGKAALPEMDRTAVEFAGYSALTQLEYGIRRGFEEGNYPERLRSIITPEFLIVNARILDLMRHGIEVFEEIDEPLEIKAFIKEICPVLFRFYEDILNIASRDRNTLDAKINPEKWRVPGSMEFMRHLKQLGCINYFVTGAVVYESGGMLEEVEACGFEVGPGKLVECMFGSTWDKKMPKDDWIKAIVKDAAIDPAKVLVVGDGRTEIKVGVEIGAVTISRLPEEQQLQRNIQIGLGTNIIVADYTDAVFLGMFYHE
ncbi:MAG: hypothetical protein L3J71_11415 [Victivallaceae bacterium]|nr:hypothetical protein [Victivallaceae bacterium]